MISSVILQWCRLYEASSSYETTEMRELQYEVVLHVPFLREG